MNIVGIIAEFNPLHNGHKYLIEKARKITNADYVIVIMSGSFTQQGNVAMFSKFDRAKTAILNGTDMVIELPTIYATSSAENFAYGAIKILDSLKCITHIVFGSECGNIDVLENIANKIVMNQELLSSSHKKHTGDTHAKVEATVLKEILSDEEYDAYLKPNNILGIEYIKAIKKLNSKIIPLTINRIHSLHNVLTPVNNFCSSTYIRENFKNKNNIKNFVPYATYNLFNTYRPVENNCIWEILKYKILSCTIDELKNIYSVNEGLENRIKKYIISCNSLDEFLDKLKCKKYLYSRLKRTMIHILLEINKDLYNEINNLSYARVLKVKNESKELLSILSKSDNIILTKVTKDILDTLPENVQKGIKLDILGTEIISTYNKCSTNDYTNQIIM